MGKASKSNIQNRKDEEMVKRYSLFTIGIGLMMMYSACGVTVNENFIEEETEQRMEAEVDSVLEYTKENRGSFVRKYEWMMKEREVNAAVLGDFSGRIDLGKYYIVTTYQNEAEGSKIRLWTREEQPELIQEISCSMNLEEAKLHCDDLNSDTNPDLEIVCMDENREREKGYLYLWDWKNNVLQEDYIEIPTKYEQVIKMGRESLVVTEQRGDLEIRKICEVDEEWGEVVTIREWSLDEKRGYLTIYDCYSGQILFDGKVENEKYCEFLFWHDLPKVIYHDTSSSAIVIWSGEYYGEEYTDKEAFLEEYGFAGEEPFFSYYDSMGDIQVELYFDEDSEKGCGISYAWRYIDKGIETVYMAGFTFDKVSEAVWTKPEPYSLLSVRGTDASASVNDYTEYVTYTEDGKIDRFYSEGMIDWLVDGYGRQRLLDIDFVYRENGTLIYRDYWHNDYVFGTTSLSVRSLYDESERIIYEDRYITHGSVERYYIYVDDTNIPVYCLELDNYTPDMIRY